MNQLSNANFTNMKYEKLVYLINNTHINANVGTPKALVNTSKDLVNQTMGFPLAFNGSSKKRIRSARWHNDPYVLDCCPSNINHSVQPSVSSISSLPVATKQIKKSEPIYYYKALFTITDQNKGSKKREMKPILLQKGSSPSVPSRFPSKQSINRKQLEITTSNRKVRSFLPRDPSGLGLDTYSRRRTSFASSVLASTMKDCPTCSSGEEQKESLSNWWPQRRNSRSLSARTPFSLHYSHIHGNPRVSQHRRASRSPEGSHRERTDRLFEGREREDRRSESKRQRRHKRVKNERIRAAEENKTYIYSRVTWAGRVEPGPPGIKASQPKLPILLGPPGYVIIIGIKN
ncbi:hypothetical protein M9H77_03141 [Catharanthus roseus]|uniref:Uncharacterized protein n=1 Tax=Catharanthus roseus TaxID=4058 RepID=A0ACC0CAV8_CATRO|nr:hypothetical protein M9H77_03141 [Catharanthus roseus]